MEDFAPSNLTSAIIKNDKSLAQVGISRVVFSKLEQ